MKRRAGKRKKNKPAFFEIEENPHKRRKKEGKSRNSGEEMKKKKTSLEDIRVIFKRLRNETEDRNRGEGLDSEENVVLLEDVGSDNDCEDNLNFGLHNRTEQSPSVESQPGLAEQCLGEETTIQDNIPNPPDLEKILSPRGQQNVREENITSPSGRVPGLFETCYVSMNYDCPREPVIGENITSPSGRVQVCSRRATCL